MHLQIPASRFPKGAFPSGKGISFQAVAAVASRGTPLRPAATSHPTGT